MYKASIVFNSLYPVAPHICGKRFATWLVKSHPLSRSGQVTLSSSCNRYNSNRAATESFLNGSSSSYVEEMYNAWLQDPKSVHVVSMKATFI